MSATSRVVVSDLGPTFGMLAFGLDAPAASAVRGSSGSPEVTDIEGADSLSRDAARAALEGGISDQRVLDELIRNDAANNRHPRSHVCAASLYGGVWFSASQHPPRASRLAAPAPLTAVILTPKIAFDPRVVSNALPRQIHTHKHARQAALAVGIVRALEAGRYAEIGELFDDAVIGQAVGRHLPGYHPIVAGSRRAGALMAGLSGRGPSIGAICADTDTAEAVRQAMSAAAEAHSILFEVLVSAVATEAGK